MALSTFQIPNGVEWPLGFIAVANNGTPVNIMSRVDANNVNAPGAAANSTNSGYTPRCHKIFFQGYKPAANNNGMIQNSGNVYILRSLGPGNNNSGGPQNRTDSGAMVYVLPPGGFATLPADESDRAAISPYVYTLDSDVDGDGALVTLTGVSR
jgi:hypothetical protein